MRDFKWGFGHLLGHIVKISSPALISPQITKTDGIWVNLLCACALSELPVGMAAISISYVLLVLILP